MKIGEGFVGEGANAAHINVVLGLRDGPVGTAWATALATPREGHVPFVAVAQPNMPIVPFTLFVNKAAIANDRHGELTWGAAQAGVAAGVGLAHQASLFDGNLDSQVLIVAVWVNPSADNEEHVFTNNRDATLAALQQTRNAGPDMAQAFAAMANPSNPYFRTN
ncbi:MAG: formaldehyde-activating enzyme [Actinomycetota bacterium]|jgi:5,6,7,8-tetrahydromethanopterin hydro-lyase